MLSGPEFGEMRRGGQGETIRRAWGAGIQEKGVEKEEVSSRAPCFLRDQDEHLELAIGFAMRSSWVTTLKAGVCGDGGRGLGAPQRTEGGGLRPQQETKEQGEEAVAGDPYLLFLNFPSSRSTIFVRLHTNGNQELQYQPGDHLGVFPGNRDDLVAALMERLEDAPPVNQLVKVELLEERSTALGNCGRAGPRPRSQGPSPSPGSSRGTPVRDWGRRDGPSSQSPILGGEWVPVTSRLGDGRPLPASWPNNLGPTG